MNIFTTDDQQQKPEQHERMLPPRNVEGGPASVARERITVVGGALTAMEEAVARHRIDAAQADAKRAIDVALPDFSRADAALLIDKTVISVPGQSESTVLNTEYLASQGIGSELSDERQRMIQDAYLKIGAIHNRGTNS